MTANALWNYIMDVGVAGSNPVASILLRERSSVVEHETFHIPLSLSVFEKRKRQMPVELHG